YFFQTDKSPLADQGNHPAVRLSLDVRLDGFRRDTLDADSGASGSSFQSAQLVVELVLADIDGLNRTAPGLERCLDGNYAFEKCWLGHKSRNSIRGNGIIPGLSRRKSHVPFFGGLPVFTFSKYDVHYNVAALHRSLEFSTDNCNHNSIGD